ncbi:MAG TPA: SRPBCC domain-containing protein [Longimicrobiaceae bacterium]|nr:SRPBCC domain-containing protein [Longimicrobiaceae bacterium]
MKTLHFTTTINAPKAKVWSTMLDDETYREWTSAFAEGSSYEGSWEQGSKIVFGDPDGNGMVSRIAENRPHEFISIEHVGFVQNGIEDTESEDAKKFAGARENYTFRETDGVTELKVDMDTDEEYRSMFEEMWPRALKKLKSLCEA